MKIIKQVINLLFLIIISPLYLIYMILISISDTDSTFWSFSQILCLFPGRFGIFLRRSFYYLAMTRCSLDCAIQFGSIFAQHDTEIGKSVYIGPFCNIGKSKIEDHCTIGSNVHILSGKEQHKYYDISVPIQNQGGIFKKVTIGEDTWIGNCAIVMANVGKKCIIGAGSVVTNDIENFSIAVGNPAKIIGKR